MPAWPGGVSGTSVVVTERARLARWLPAWPPGVRRPPMPGQPREYEPRTNMLAIDNDDISTMIQSLSGVNLKLAPEHGFEP